ncbi:MAG TPA: magnesium transporter CorA family protein [Gemmatimonadaceae bacterium]|nr:magnesium transporter CorA family protein [Gemmatimonadaceae bacterium]
MPETTVAPSRDSAPPRTLYLAPDGTVQKDLSPSDVNRAIASHDGLLWIDLDTTCRPHVAILEHVCKFHPLTIEDTLNPNSRVKLDEYAEYLFLVIRGVRFYESTEDPYDLETFNLYFYLGRRFLVTVHAGPSAAVEAVSERIGRNPELLSRGVDRIAHSVMDAAIDAYFPLLDQIDEFVDTLEQRVFENFEQDAIRDIFAVKRTVLSLRRHLAPQREVFNALANRPTSLLSPESQLYFRDVHDHVLRINDSLETYRDLLSSTLDSYLTQVSNRLGTATKGLSIFATVTLPFVIVSGMWGMNFQHIPLAAHPFGFWILLGLQLAIGLTLLGILRFARII